MAIFSKFGMKEKKDKFDFRMAIYFCEWEYFEEYCKKNNISFQLVGMNDDEEYYAVDLFEKDAQALEIYLLELKETGVFESDEGPESKPEPIEEKKMDLTNKISNADPAHRESVRAQLKEYKEQQENLPEPVANPQKIKGNFGILTIEEQERIEKKNKLQL